jgi:AraC family transcriptional regulator of adaptative response / methylphosphotriester-DNA alkyltransferase methyltransferase
MAANYRPCKRCKPTNEVLPDSEWVDLITDYINNNYTKKLTLKRLADVSHGSSYHLQRTYKRIKGITPFEYIQEIRLNEAKKYLIHSERTVADIAIAIGIPNTPYFITLFKRKNGCTPTQYRQLHRNNH